jgi:pyruvate,orthophosphate dikinase
LSPASLDALLHPSFDKKALAAAKPVARGLPASPGAACGAVVFTAEDAEEAFQGRKVVLVRWRPPPRTSTA